MNVDLRPLIAGDLPSLDAWLPSVAASVGYDAARITVDAPPEHPRTTIVLRDDEVIGVTVHARLSKRPRSAVIEFVGITPAHARRGCGHRAATLLEESLRAAGVRRIYAPAPAAHGIDVYFWIRLGYRPLLRPDWPCALDGVAWLCRDLEP